MYKTCPGLLCIWIMWILDSAIVCTKRLGTFCYCYLRFSKLLWEWNMYIAAQYTFCNVNQSKHTFLPYKLSLCTKTVLCVKNCKIHSISEYILFQSRRHPLPLRTPGNSVPKWAHIFLKSGFAAIKCPLSQFLQKLRVVSVWYFTLDS